MDIEQRHTTCCWSGLNEATLRHVYDEFSLELPSPPHSEKGDDLEVVLAVDLACKFNPKTEEQAVVSQLLQARRGELATDDSPDFDLEWVKDNSLEKDAQAIQACFEQQSARKQSTKASVVKLAAVASECWRKSSGYDGPRPKVKQLAGAKLSSAVDRVYAKLAASADTFLRAALLEGCGVFTDNFNGRWKITFKATHAQRSFSWTQAGSDRAACIAVAWAWEQKFGHDGCIMPPDTAGLCDGLGIPCTVATT